MRDTVKYVDEVTHVLDEALTPDKKRDLLLELMWNYAYQKRSNKRTPYFSREKGSDPQRYRTELFKQDAYETYQNDLRRKLTNNLDPKSQKYFMYRTIHSIDHRQWNDPLMSKKIDGLFEKFKKEMGKEVWIDIEQKSNDLFQQVVDFPKHSRRFPDQKNRNPLEGDALAEEFSSNMRTKGIKKKLQQYLKAHELQEDLDLKMQKDPALADQVALQLTVNYMLKNFNAAERKHLKHRARQRANRRALIGAALVFAGALVLFLVLFFFL